MENAIKLLWKNKAVVSLYYLISLALSGIFAFSIYKTLLSKATLSLNPLIRDFDFMLFMDALRVYKSSLVPYGLTLLYIVAFYGFLHTFLTGGIIYAVITNKLRFQRFFIYSWRYWAKNLLYTTITALFFLCVVTLSISIIYLSNDALKNPNFRTNILINVPGMVFLLVCSIILFLFWDYSRVLAYKYPLKSRTFKNAWKIILTKRFPIKTFTILTLFTLMLLGIYLLLDYFMGMTNVYTIVFMIVTQQIYIYLRIFLRLLHYKLIFDFV